MKTQWIAISSAALLAVILVSAGGCQVIRAGYETAPYRVLESDGAFCKARESNLQPGFNNARFLVSICSGLRRCFAKFFFLSAT